MGHQEAIGSIQFEGIFGHLHTIGITYLLREIGQLEGIGRTTSGQPRLNLDAADSLLMARGCPEAVPPIPSSWPISLKRLVMPMVCKWPISPRIGCYRWPPGGP